MDHVFPRSLYDRLPNPAVTVPACVTCQGETRSHEDAFRDFVVGSSYRHDAARTLWPRVRRSLRYNRARGEALVASIRRVEVRTRTGLILGAIDTFRVDPAPINEALNKIVRGLWYRDIGYVFPAESVRWGYAYATPVSEPLPDAFGAAMRSLPIRYAGPEVAYRFTAMPEDNRVSLTWIAYGDAMFGVSTFPLFFQEPVNALRANR